MPPVRSPSVRLLSIVVDQVKLGAAGYGAHRIALTRSVTHAQHGHVDESLVSIALATAVETAVNIVLPTVLLASCAGQVLQAVGGFIALLGGATAIVAVQAIPVAGQAISTGAAVAWLGGWVAWTGSLIEAAEACD